jgi:FMN phosphatase YigB (HAD superfamily)
MSFPPLSSLTAGAWLPRVRRALADPEVRLVSCDVFDTLLLRDTTPEPARFWQMARRAQEALTGAGHQAPSALDILFARLQAAYIAYRAAPLTEGERDASYEQILDLWLAGLELPPSVGEVLTQVEMAYEAEHLRPNPDLIRLLAQARANGRRLVLLSDMYLGQKRIEGLVRRLAPEMAWDRCYVSCDLGVTKRGGGLFRQMLTREELAPHQALHLGDDPQADLRQALHQGLNAVATPRPAWWRMKRGFRLRRFYREMARRGLVFPNH